MNVEKFNKKFAEKGGFKKLSEMRTMNIRVAEIASYFGISKFSVNKYMVKLFGVKYDPRQARRESIINDMVSFLQLHPREQFESTYFDRSKSYRREAIKRFKEFVEVRKIKTQI
jgi:hypothetical protein